MLTERFVKDREAKGEVVGGGYIVFRRGKQTGRLGVKKSAIIFEHPDFESAVTEAKRLTIANPGEKFVVFRQISDTVFL